MNSTNSTVDVAEPTNNTPSTVDMLDPIIEEEIVVATEQACDPDFETCTGGSTGDVVQDIIATAEVMGDPNAYLMNTIYIGLNWSLNFFLPFFMWYVWRRPAIIHDAEAGVNTWYSGAWQFMWMSHFFTYLLPTLAWPFTYLSWKIVNDLYFILCTYVGTLVGWGVNGVTIILFIIAGSVYQETTTLASWAPWVELVLYVILVGGGWFASYFVAEGAFFYYASKDGRPSDDTIAEQAGYIEETTSEGEEEGATTSDQTEGQDSTADVTQAEEEDTVLLLRN